MSLDPTTWGASEEQLSGLVEAGTRLRHITEHVRDVFWLEKPRHGGLLYVSPAYESVWGRTVESLFAEPITFLDAVVEEDRERVEAAQRTKDSETYDIEYRIRRPDGTIRWIHDRAFPIRDATGEVVRIAGIAQDVTETRLARAQLAASERRFRALFEHSTELITVVDRDRRRIFVSKAAKAVLGIAPDDPTELPLGGRVHPQDLPMLERAMERAIAAPGVPIPVEYRQRRANDSYGIFEGIITSLLDVKEVEAMVICARDVTDVRFVDPLTQLPNESCLLHHLDFVWGQPGEARGRYSTIAIDIDGFNAVTASLGEAEADRIIVALGRRLSEIIRHPSMLGRLYGDRFLAVLDGVDAVSGVLRVLRELRACLEAPFQSAAGPLTLTAGFGVFVSPPKDDSAAEILRSTEVALTGAKRHGAGKHEFFEESMRARARERLDTESALRQAIAAEELLVYYQPIFDLGSGHLAGFEALSRWERPGVGFVPPDVFIPVAEQSELIYSLDFAVLRRSAAQILDWRKRYPGLEGLYVSINLSARHFDREELVRDLDRILAEVGGPVDAICFEITESVLIEQPDRAAETIRTLRERGYRFALDDFGKGYSSISYLHRFAVHTLKIDREFISSLGQPEESPALVRAIIRMAHELGLKVVAEGVETKEQLAFLRDADCELAQGFGLARPMSASDAEALLSRNLIV